VVEAAATRAGAAGEEAGGSAEAGLGVGERDDVRRPRRERRQLDRAGGDVQLPRVHALLHPRHRVVAEPEHLRARQRAELGGVARPEDEHVEPGLAGDERVVVRAPQVDDAVAGCELVRRLVLPEQPGARAHVEDLL
jgi:hypothetical protein